MENKLATTVGEIFSTTEKIVAQHDKVAVGDMAETLVIEFDQDRYEELLSSGKSSPVSLRKYRKITMAKTESASTDDVLVKGNNVQGSMPITISVSNKILKASKPVKDSDRTGIVFPKANFTSNRVANPVVKTK